LNVEPFGMFKPVSKYKKTSHIIPDNLLNLNNFFFLA